MAQKYYNSQDVAKVLGVSVNDVKQMVERHELHGYRDGSDWKFKAEDIDGLAKERKPAKAAEPGAIEGDDVLLSEVELGQADSGTSGTVIAMNWGERGAPDSDIKLAEDSKAPGAAKKKPSDSKGKLGGSDLSLRDSSVALAGQPAAGGKKPGTSDVDLAGGRSDDDLVLAGSKPGSDVTLSGDSGISLVDASDSGLSLEEPLLSGAGEESLELGEDDMLAAGEGSDAMAPVAVKPDDDFLLTPLEEAADAQESGSGSQVIALDTEEAAGMSGVSSGVGGAMAAMLEEDLTAQPALAMGGPAPVLAAQPAALMEGTPLMVPEAFPEAPYTGLQIAGLAACAVLLMFCGMMTYDLLRNVLGWESPYTVNSTLMDAILSLVEGK